MQSKIILAILFVFLTGTVFGQSTTVTCRSPNGGFKIDGGAPTILSQGQTGTYQVGESGSEIALWSCVTSDSSSCQWLSYIALPGSAWEIIETGNGYEIAMRELEIVDPLVPRWQIVDNVSGPQRASMTMAFDSDRMVTVLFGGRAGSVNSDTWEFDGISWRQIATPNSPPARYWHSMTYDSDRQRMVLYGGGNRDLGILYEDTWEYDGTDWYEVVTSSSPGPLDQMSMAFNSHTNNVVLFGGQSFAGEQNETWEYDGTNWSQVLTTHSPRRGTLAAMTFDSVRKRVVFFGSGVVFDPDPSDCSTWEYDGIDWIETITTNTPPGRWAHSMAYDSANQRAILFGGYGVGYPSGTQTNDTWAYDGTNWVELFTDTVPFEREQHGMAYDSVRNRIIVYGGWSPSGNDTWELIDELSPQEGFDNTLNLINYSVQEGTLEGSGSGNSADGRLGAIINMIENANYLIDEGQTELACEQLQAASNRTDGLSPPPDFVTGTDAEELFNLIEALRDNLEC